jgi:hypothetical protein
MQAIGNIIQLNQVKTNPGLGRLLEAAVVIARVNEFAAGKWQAVRYRNYTLFIDCPHPIQSQELMLQKEKLRQQFNVLLNGEVVKRLVIRTSYN